MKTLKNRTALVTGASYGIGKAIAIGLARQGCDLILVARGQKGLKETAKRVEAAGRKTLIIPTDIADTSQVQKMVKKVQNDFGVLHILVNNASGKINPEAEHSIVNTSQKTIDELMNTTVRGTMLVTKALLPLLSSSGDAHVIFIVSDWALFGSHGPSIFAAAKAAVAQFARTESKNAIKDNIKMTCIFPGDVASFDEDWQVPKWDIDDPLEAVVKELGNSRIPLIDVVDTVIYALSRKMCKVDEIIISPINPDYSF